jgi:hypothetical protein
MTDATREPSTPCPRCGQPTATYYDERSTWDGCARCRVRWWVGDGYSVPTGLRPPPPGAKPAPMVLYDWEEIDSPQ